MTAAAKRCSWKIWKGFGTSNWEECVSLMLLQNDVNYFVGVGYGLDSSRPDGRGEFTDPIGREVS
jgi:hypothetical protein